MKYLLIIILMFSLAGCNQKTSHTAGDLTPYLDWPEGTVVIVHLAATGPDGVIREGLTSKGKIFKINKDEIRLISEPKTESIGYARELVWWVEKAKTN